MIIQRKFDSFNFKNKIINWAILILIIQIAYFEIKVEYKKYKTRKKLEIELESRKANDLFLEQQFDLLKKSYIYSVGKASFTQNQTHRNNKKLCSEVPGDLIGHINVTQKLPFDYWPTSNYRKDFARQLEMGGVYKPIECEARHRVAIIIPFKNRLLNLNFFLYHMHPILQRQQLNYQIFVVEQFNDELFNKGVLNNAAFLEIFKIYNLTIDLDNLSNYPFDCVIYHDVDLLPEGIYRFFILTDKYFKFHFC